VGRRVELGYTAGGRDAPLSTTEDRAMTATEKVPTLVKIRWMTPKDIDEVLQIEYGSFEDVWTADDFKKHLSKKTCVVMLAYRGNANSLQTVGYFAYQQDRTSFTLLKIAVHPDHRRHGIGTQMLDKLMSKLMGSCRIRATAMVRDRDVISQKFFRAMSWRSEKVLRRYFPPEEDLKLEADDGILFAYNVPLDDVGLKC
jgi:ribosomal-protein-alanine N-acetyltransferase